MRSAALLSLIFITVLNAQVKPNLPPFSTYLFANDTIVQIAADVNGNIYVLGQSPDSPIAGNGQDVFVAKLPPAADRLQYEVFLGGSAAETAASLAVDGAGNAYVTGITGSYDFPTASPNAAGPSSPLPFVVKLDGNGAVVYSTLFSKGAVAYPRAIAVDNAGEAIVTGLANDTSFPVTAGAYSNVWNGAPPFVVKLDAAGAKLVFSAVGVGGSSIALDSTGHIFVSGSTVSSAYPTTAGAFQRTFTQSYSCSFLCQIGIPSDEQYVTALSVDGSKLIYSTYVTGTHGASNTGLAVDSSGNAWVTGYTISDDYPYTTPKSSASRSGTFTTKLDPAGSKVLVSVQQGGFNQIGNTHSYAVGPTLVLDAQGNAVIVGSFTPPPTDPIELEFSVGRPYPPVPANALSKDCLPGTSDAFGFNNDFADLAIGNAYAMRLSGSDGSILNSQVLPGTSLGQVTPAIDQAGNIYLAGSTALPDIPLTAGVVFDNALSQRTTPGAFLARVAFSQGQLGCATDSVTGRFVGPVAPGQLITLYGTDFGPADPSIGLASSIGIVPTSLAGISVTFDGKPAPLLYASSGQINVQVPYEVRQNVTTKMQVSFNDQSIASRIFPVIPVNPSLFVTSYLIQPLCNGVSIGNMFFTALALNEDGSVNSCANPAKAGSLVTLFVNGLGVDAGNQTTGALTTIPKPIYTNPAASLNGPPFEFVSFTDQAGALSGLGQIQVRIPAIVSPPILTNLSLGVNGLIAGPFSVGTTPGTPSNVAIFVK